MAEKKKHLVVINMKTLGSAGGRARAAKLTDAQRLTAARRANKARWDAYYLANPDKVRPKKRKRRAA